MELRSWPIPLFIIAFAVVLAGLIYGSGFLIPLAISLFLWNILSAIIEAFEKVHLPRWLATVVSILLVALVFSFVFRILASQADAVSQVWPDYVKRIEQLLSRAAAEVGPDIERRAREALAEIDLTSQIGTILGSARSFLVGLILVVLYCGFLFVEMRHVPQKIRAIFAKQEDAEDVGRILSSMSTSLRRYFGVKTVVSIIVALGSYVVLKAIGLDFAETWAFLVFLLNFIPNVGSTIAVIFPALLALVQYDQIWPFLVISVVLTGLQMVVGNVIEPMFMGRTLNLSPFVVIVSLVFWGMIWGAVGMFLAVPITVFILIVCEHMPRWRWIAVLLSKEGKLSK